MLTRDSAYASACACACACVKDETFHPDPENEIDGVSGQRGRQRCIAVDVIGLFRRIFCGTTVKAINIGYLATHMDRVQDIREKGPGAQVPLPVRLVGLA